MKARLLLKSLEDRIAPATFTVSNTDDGPADGSGNFPAGTLRRAIQQANAANDADTIVFDASFTTSKSILMQQGQFNITQPVTITGPGASLLTINGQGQSRVFNISGAGVLAITMSGMTITGGTLGSGDGGGLYIANENVTLNSVIITGNATTTTTTNSGGGIGVASNGLLTITNSTISGNSSSGAGGGIYFYYNGQLVLTNSTVSGNAANGAGST